MGTLVVSLILAAAAGGDAKPDAKALEAACAGGSVADCADLGGRLLYGEGVKKNVDKGIELLKKACDAKDGKSCLRLAAHYDTEKNPFLGFMYHGRACGYGVALSCGLVASAYATGNGVTKDPAKADDYFARSCELGNLEICSDAGAVFLQREQKDPVRAAKLLVKACDAGQALGCGYLALLYQHGVGVAQDTAKAVALYQKACDGGNSAACDNAKKLGGTPKK